MSQFDMHVSIKGQPDAVLAPGDSLDLGDEGGVIVWLKDEDAGAFRLQQAKRAREVSEVVAHVEQRVAGGARS